MPAADNSYPIFGLAFCVFETEIYVEQIVPEFLRFKYEQWGHSEVVLHEHDMRKPTAKNGFGFLHERDRREAFFASLNDLVRDVPMAVFASYVLKNECEASSLTRESPYAHSLRAVMIGVHDELPIGASEAVPFVFESRGAKEDAELELDFLRTKDAIGRPLWSIHFAKKASNDVGLQIADLVARPIGLQVLRPAQPNRAFDILEPKIPRWREGPIIGYYGCGLTVFPRPKVVPVRWCTQVAAQPTLF